MDSNNILEIKDLNVSYKVYGGHLKVLNGISMTLPRGQSIGLVGESGCGKTTTLKTLLKVLPKQAVVERGCVNYNGKDVLTMPKDELTDFRRKGAGMIFQDPTAALNPVFTIKSQLFASLKYAFEKKPAKKEMYQRAVNALSEVALPDPDRIMTSYPFQLSGGMRQRVCIAATIAADRKILLADEPGTSLDVTIQDQILRLINDLVQNKGLSVIIVSHSLGVIRQVTKFVYIMYAGTIVESGETEEVFNNPKHPYTMALMNCVPKLTGSGIAKGIPGRIPDYLNPPEGCRFSPRCPLADELCRSTKPDTILTGNNHWVACFQAKEVI